MNAFRLPATENAHRPGNAAFDLSFGEATDVACPVCRKERLTRVNYVYGDHLGPTSGQAKTEAELARMDAMQDRFTVYEVEVCRSCGWNHLDASYVLGAEPVPGQQPRRSRRRVATE